MNGTATALLTVSVVFPVLSFLFVLMRLGARRVRATKVGADDWVIVASQVMCFALMVNAVIPVAKGVIGEPQRKLMMQHKVPILLKAIYADAFLVFFSLTLVKVGILLFYKRVFALKKFLLAANIMIGIIIAWFVASFFGLLFSQTPISTHWNPMAKNITHNIDFPGFLITHACLDLVLDISILCFPIPAIITLHMEKGRKLALIAIFWMGAFCCVAEAVRIYYFHKFLYEDLQSHADAFGPVVANVFIWSRIEPCCSVIAACLPCLGPLVNARGPASIVASIRSAISLGSLNSRGTNRSNQNKSENPSNTEESRRDWTRLDGSREGSRPPVDERNVGLVEVEPLPKREVEDK
ncbi:hypothetical protein N0V90_011253 [Kalmusia sp. IMI 367209]|nr:hypothetical protein N0V90_011253 [Kalmusia sp. IMI 367209]